MSDREFDELVDAMRENHNKPPETPRDRMWERIEHCTPDDQAPMVSCPATVAASTFGKYGMRPNWKSRNFFRS